MSENVPPRMGRRYSEHDTDDDDLPPVGLDVNRFIDRSKDFIAHSGDGSVWVVDLGSLKNMAGHFGYRVLDQALGKSAYGDVSDVVCEPLKRGPPIYLKAKPARFTLKYETVVPGQDRNFSLFGMEITEAYELDRGYSPAVLKPSDAFPSIDKMDRNKLVHVVMEVGKISDGIDRLRISLEKTAMHIYR